MCFGAFPVKGQTVHFAFAVHCFVLSLELNDSIFKSHSFIPPGKQCERVYVVEHDCLL